MSKPIEPWELEMRRAIKTAYCNSLEKWVKSLRTKEIYDSPMYAFMLKICEARNKCASDLFQLEIQNGNKEAKHLNWSK